MHVSTVFNLILACEMAKIQNYGNNLKEILIVTLFASQAIKNYFNIYNKFL